MRVDTVARALGISLMVGTLAQGAMAQDAAPPAAPAVPQATATGLSADAIAFRDGLAREIVASHQDLPAGRGHDPDE